MLIINTNNEEQLYEYEIKRKQLIEDKLAKGSYSIDDVRLVRTTNFIETEHVVHPICNVPFLTHINNIINVAVTSLEDEIEHIDFYQDMERYMERKEKITKKLPLSTQYRSTVHFTLNGLVQSHSKGNFDNQNFIIIDNLAHHLASNHILSFRAEDTYMNGDVSLSPQSVVLVRKDKYEELLTQFPMLKNYNIVLFEGDETKAVEMFLTTQGIVSEKIGEHGFDLESKTGGLLGDLLVILSKVNNIESVPHNLSESYKDDDIKSLVLWEYYDNLFYTFLLAKLNYDDSEKNILLEKLNSLDPFNDNDVMFLKDFIKKIGLDNFYQICSEFNAMLKNKIENNNFPTNSELIRQIHEKRQTI